MMRDREALLIRMFGLRSLVFFGNASTYDRYRWLKKRLRKTKDKLRLLDVGCGNGWAVNLGSELGYESIGLTWANEDKEKAERRRDKLKGGAKFVVHDARELDKLDLGKFDVVVNLENIEHILDDEKLVRDISNLLNVGGIVLLTTPYFFYDMGMESDAGPYKRGGEDGWHVRRGYTQVDLRYLAEKHGLLVEEISFCTGRFSMALCAVHSRLGERFFKHLSVLSIPLKVIVNRLDRLFWSRDPKDYLSICMIAQKKRD